MLKGHREDCGCPACRGHEVTEARRRAEAEQAQTSRDSAWFAVMNAGGPAAVIAVARRHGDPGRAVRLLTAAGLDTAGITDRYREDAPQQSSSSGGAGPWAGSPDHDPRVTRALLRGASDAELSKIREQVTAEYRQTAAQRAARRQSAVMWRTPSGEAVRDGSGAPPGVSLSPDGAPVQRSVTYADEAGSESA
jgi:hypothetical protein